MLALWFLFFTCPFGSFTVFQLFNSHFSLTSFGYTFWLNYTKNYSKIKSVLHSKLNKNTSIQSQQFKCFGNQHRLVSSQMYFKACI